MKLTKIINPQPSHQQNTRADKTSNTKTYAYREERRCYSAAERAAKTQKTQKMHTTLRVDNYGVYGFHNQSINTSRSITA